MTGDIEGFLATGILIILFVGAIFGLNWFFKKIGWGSGLE